MHGVEGRQYRLDVSGVPGRRPGLAGQVLDDERGREAVVVPSEATGKERVSVQRFVHAALVAEPIRGVVEGGDLHERRAPSAGRRRTVGSRGRRARTRDATRPVPPPGHGAPADVGRVRLHASEATEVARVAVGSIADMAVRA